MDVVCPIMVLNAKEVIVAIDTPLERVRVSKISAYANVSLQPHGPGIHLDLLE